MEETTINEVAVTEEVTGTTEESKPSKKKKKNKVSVPQFRAWKATIECFNEATNEIDIDDVLMRESLDVLEDWTGCSYFGIIHDKDFQEDGKPRSPHVHIVMIFEKKVAKQRVLNVLRGAFSIVDVRRISARECDFLAYELKYLTHSTKCPRGATPKYLYNLEDVYTNCHREYWRVVLNDSPHMSAMEIKEVCIQCKWDPFLIRDKLGDYFVKEQSLIRLAFMQRRHGSITESYRQPSLMEAIKEEGLSLANQLDEEFTLDPLGKMPIAEKKED